MAYDAFVVEQRKKLHLGCCQFVADAEKLDEYLCHVSSVIQLLIYRQDLVEEYFSMESFVRKDGEELMREFLCTQQKVGPGCAVAKLSRKVLQELTETINIWEICVREITPEELNRFFRCSADKPLVVKTRKPMIELLVALAHAGIIAENWPNLIAERGLLIANGSKSPCTYGSLRKEQWEVNDKYKNGDNPFDDSAQYLKRVIEAE